MILLAWPATALASEGEGAVAAALKLISGLGIVLGLFLLLYAFGRRHFSAFAPAKAGAIKVVETRYLAPKKALYLVEVRGEEFLLGMGQERLELIAALGRRSASFEEALASQELSR